MFTEDLPAFFADWGEAGTVDGEPVTVIYGAPGEVLPLGGAGMSADMPRALIQAATLPARPSAPDADPVLVLPDRVPTRWWVRDVKPDGMGLATLILAEHPDQS